MRFDPHPYQRRGASFLVGSAEAALFWDPGLGKTAVTLKAFQALRKAGAVRRMLVVAPLRVAQLVWTQDGDGEIGKWDDFADLKVSLLHGPDKAAALAADADVYVINYDGLDWLAPRGRDGQPAPACPLTQLLARGVDLVAFDELSKLKHPSTRRFKAIKPWLGRFRRRWGLTGTPASNGLLDLFGQAYCLDLGRSLGRYITHYRAAYFTPAGFGGYTWVLRPGADAEIHGVLAGRRCADPRCRGDVAAGACVRCGAFARPLAQALRAEDCLDLPELVERDVAVELPAAARRAYDELERELLTLIDGEEVTAANAAVAANKCRQVASGAIYAADRPAGLAAPPGGREWLAVHDAKIEAVLDLVDELQGQPLLVAYEYQHELERLTAALAKQLGAPPPALRGGLSGAQAAAVVDAWNAGATPVLLAHPAAAGHGLNLQRGGAHVCWLTLTWDLELYEQLNRRLWRQGSRAARVVVHRILARRSVDHAVRDALARKRGGQDALLEALRRPGWRRRGG